MTSTDEPEVSIAEMLRRIESGRAELDHVFAAASPPDDAWSVKDHMAHIACWEQSALALLNGEARQGHVGIGQGHLEGLDTTGINDRIFALYHDTPEPEVRALYDQVHAALLARLRSMTDDDLKRPYSHYQPDDPPYNANPVWPWIVGNTFGHYEEHIKYLRARAEPREQ